MNAQLLKTLILQGHRVAVEHTEGGWKVFIYLMPNGNFQGTFFCDTIQASLETGLSSFETSREEIETDFSNNYKVITPVPLLLKVGDRVEILENCRELAISEGWRGDPFNMIGQNNFKVQASTASAYSVCTKDEFDFWYFPHWTVAKYEPPVESKIDIQTVSEKIGQIEKLQEEILKLLK